MDIEDAQLLFAERKLAPWPKAAESPTLFQVRESALPSPSENKLAQKLERVAELAIDQSEVILRLTLPPPEDESFGAVLRAKNSAANTILATQVKVDENRLRKAAVDLLPDIIRVAREEAEKIKAAIDANA